MAKIPFNVNAYTARLIGRENVSKLSGAILELVKNTYDADASICILYYEKTTNTLYLIDNGSGMSSSVIKKHWMTIGFSSKKNKYITKKGRIQTGAKGIGRFALDRIGSDCAMLTISENEKLLWNVSWNDFNENKNITDITADLDTTDISINDFIDDIVNHNLIKLIDQEKITTGTVFKISNLSDQWTDALVNNIKNTLVTLIPAELKNIFNIYFFEESTSIEDGEIIGDDGVYSFDYKVSFKTQENQKIKILINRSEFEFGKDFDEVMLKAKFTDKDKSIFLGELKEINRDVSEYCDLSQEDITKLGDFNGTFYFSKIQYNERDREKYYYKKAIGDSGFKESLSGIRIYRDNFRVRPYGEPNSSSYDWLQLSSRKNASPAAISHKNGKWRVNSNQMMGSIFISRMNLFLPDQANREGIIETKEFIAFRNILIGIISEFEEDRQSVARKLSDYYDLKTEVSRIEKEILEKANKEENSKEKRTKEEVDKSKNSGNSIEISASDVKKVIDKKDEIISSLEDENRLLRVLATTGIVTNTYIHEFKELTHKLRMNITMATESLKFDRDIEDALSHLEKANKIKDSFNSWFLVTIGSVKRDKRKEKNIKIKNYMNELIEAWKSVLDSKNVGIDFTIDDDNTIFRCFPYELETIVNNLISNSNSSFEKNGTEEKKIKIEIYNEEKNLVISYSDNGAGLSKAYKKNPYKILEPFETSRTDERGEKTGTGMGMWIIDKTVKEYHGSIDLNQNMTKNDGFEIIMRLSKKKGDKND